MVLLYLNQLTTKGINFPVTFQYTFVVIELTSIFETTCCLFQSVLHSVVHVMWIQVQVQWLAQTVSTSTFSLPTRVLLCVLVSKSVLIMGQFFPSCSQIKSLYSVTKLQANKEFNFFLNSNIKLAERNLFHLINYGNMDIMWIYKLCVFIHLPGPI